MLYSQCNNHTFMATQVLPGTGTPPRVRTSRTQMTFLATGRTVRQCGSSERQGSVCRLEVCVQTGTTVSKLTPSGPQRFSGCPRSVKQTWGTPRAAAVEAAATRKI